MPIFNPIGRRMAVNELKTPPLIFYSTLRLSAWYVPVLLVSSCCNYDIRHAALHGNNESKVTTHALLQKSLNWRKIRQKSAEFSLNLCLKGYVRGTQLFSLCATISAKQFCRNHARVKLESDRCEENIGAEKFLLPVVHCFQSYLFWKVKLLFYSLSFRNILVFSIVIVKLVLCASSGGVDKHGLPNGPTYGLPVVNFWKLGSALL